ncbi:MAG TPA: AI-2E family transporter [Gaiellaceae bacterium]|nr:AI-2E family transporter [Gaiellaceae bacterium]
MRFVLPFRRRRSAEPGAEAPAEDKEDVEQVVVQLDDEQLRALSTVFSAPRWLRDLGIAAWFLVGVGVLLVGLTWVLGVTSTITEPVVTAGVVATVASPGVTYLQRFHIPRGFGALIVLLALAALGGLILLLVLGGIVAQGDQISKFVKDGADKIQGWMEDVGVDTSAAASANSSVSTATSATISTLVHGVASGIREIASLAFGISLTLFSIFFLLKDGPAFRAWVNRHLGVPAPVAATITGGIVVAMRRYFLGVTIVAAFNATVVGIGALVLGVPLAGTIAVVTFVTAYIPFIGAVIAGAFAVLLALGAKGTAVALVMLVIVILANGLLQNVVQPIAMGATLRMNPLLILVVTISAGAFFGTVGMIVAAPLTSAAIHISADLGRVRSVARRTKSAEPTVVAEQPA